MVGAEYLNSGNPKTLETPLDILLKKIGGTFYSRCYTPAPDTPRSSACMWTGEYPKRNGCDNRLKYPKRFLKTDADFWHLLQKEGYTFNIYMRETDVQIGTLPSGFESYVKCGTLDSYLDGLHIEERSLTFFYFHDLHSYLDSHGYTLKQLHKGLDFLTSLIKSIFEKLDPEQFDYIILFSDHGFRFEGQGNPHLIDDDRVKTTMFLRKKGDQGFTINEELRSNLDVCPTILEIAGIPVPPGMAGKSLLGTGHEYILIEDHDDFSVRLSQSVEHWAVFTGNNKYWLECSGKWEMDAEDEAFDKVEFEKEITEKMNDYLMNRRLWDALHIYDGNKLEDRTYSDGRPIKKPFYRSKAILGTKIIFRKIWRLYHG